MRLYGVPIVSSSPGCKMISFFRRALSSWIVLGLIGLVFVAIVVTGVGTPGGLGDASASNGETLARVGSQSIGTTDVNDRLKVQLESLRQQQPGIDMPALVRDGTFDKVLNGLTDIRAIQAFAESQGVFISDRLIDGKIADIDAFKGPTGKFDRARFDGLLAQRNISEKSLRADIARDILGRIIGGPAAAGAKVPAGIVTPFASLMLETRQGSITVVASSAMGVGAQPTPQELSAFYTRNAKRYTVPELRVIKYATFDKSRFDGKVTPTDAEIAAAYQKNAAKYGAKETRNLSQIIVQDAAAAKNIATQISNGGNMSAAAKSAGVDVLTLTAQDKKAYVNLSASAVADAVFNAQRGAVVGPLKSGLGWHIVRVDAVDVVAGQSLASVRTSLATALTSEKTAAALSNLVAEIDDAIADGQSFDDVVKAQGLVVVTTPALTASGISPDNNGFKAPTELAPVLKDAFQAELDDDAVVINTSAESYAFFDLDRIVPSAPKPLAQIATTVAGDFVVDRASREAKKVADAIAAKVNGGLGVATAISGTGKALRAPSPVTARRVDLLNAGERVPPPLALMFSMSARQAKVLEAPDKQGWFVVWLDKIVPGNAGERPELIAATQGQLSQVVGEEYNQQFVSAIKARLAATRDAGAIARAKRALTGPAAP
jgi:peptidyl-prolyl cis-trans isomerase D